jgi:hypothetical protein
MGIYVEYRPCDPDGPLKQLLSNLTPFSDWYATEFAEDGSPAVLDLLVSMVENDSADLRDLPTDTWSTFDHLVSEFYGFYCDTADRGLPKHVPCGSLHVRRYRQLHNDIAGQVEDRCSRLWSYIFQGRPIALSDTTREFVSDDGNSWVSWWSLEEITYLRRSLPGVAHGSGETEGVLECAHCALEHAESVRSGLVVTAF